NAIAQGWAESQFHPSEVDNNVDATNFRVCGGGTSIDRGLWQVNGWIFPSCGASCALNQDSEADFVYRLTAGGVDWRYWPATFGGASYVSELRNACSA